MSAPVSARTARLSVTGLMKSFSGVRVVQDVRFEAHAGRVLGIAGENGSGKSTTMNLITGVLPRDAGTVLLDGMPFAPASPRASDDAGVVFIHQELNIFPNLSVAENLFLTHPQRRIASLPFISRGRMQLRTRELLRRVNLEINPQMHAGALSAGERQLLEIARALVHEARVLILDEPTSSLTPKEAARLFEIIRQLQADDVAILYISHALEDMLALSNDILVMRDGQVTLKQPNVGLSTNDLILAMVGRPIEGLFPQRVPQQLRRRLLEVEGLSQPGVLQDINLQVAPGEILGIAGLMGSGRSELARAIFGLDSYRSGSVRVDGRELPRGDVVARLGAGVAFLTEDRRQEGLMPGASVADNLALASLPRFAANRITPLRRRELEVSLSKLVSRVQLKSGNLNTTPVRALSGGNQQKVVLGRWLLREPRVFILDEPTRGVDVAAKAEIYRLLVQLAEAGIAILMISSELEELTGLCDRILVMRGGALVREFSIDRFDREAILRCSFGQETA